MQRINIGYVPAYGPQHSIFYVEGETVWLFANGSSSNFGSVSDFAKRMQAGEVRFAPHPGWSQFAGDTRRQVNRAVEILLKHWPGPIGVRIDFAYYGPRCAPARAAALAEILGERVCKSDRRVGWNRWIDCIGVALGITSWTCLADFYDKIGEMIHNARQAA